MMNGILNVYKERGFTSHDVVAKLRGILKMKKIGHTGTLDPDACGVLPVCLGQATKVCGLLTDRKKTYEAVLLLGRETDTQDTSGQTLRERPVTAGEEQIRQTVGRFLGRQMQLPPMYSALKVGGKRLYELAREGKTVERTPRPVFFYEIEILAIALPRVKLRVTCSKGTYIRTLCHDIGEALGCGGCMEELLRTEVEPFRVEESLRLSEIEALAAAGRVQEVIWPADRLFGDWPAVSVREEFSRYMYNGNPLKAQWLAWKESPASGQELPFMIRLYTKQGVFFGTYEFDKEKACYRLKKMFYGG